MNICFFDQSKDVFLKVVSDSMIAEREYVGAKVFSSFVGVAVPERLDTKTILTKRAPGESAVMCDDEVLTQHIIRLLENVYSVSVPVSGAFSLAAFVQALIDQYETYPSVRDFLIGLSSELEEHASVPIHGDLQKQNIFICESGLILIDFEHFCYGPKEYEFVNSLYHSDGNCLNADILVQHFYTSGSITTTMLTKMLILYGVKEHSQGASASEVHRKVQQGLSRMTRIVQKPIKQCVPDFAREQRISKMLPSCFA